MYQPTTSKSSIEAAAEAAQKVNAMLIAKGKLKPSQLAQNPLPKPRQVSVSSAFHAEVCINDAPAPVRNMLTRGNTQEEISKSTQAAVSTRGRYMSDEDKLKFPSEKPLYLSIQGPDQFSISAAVRHIEAMISSHQQRQDVYKENRFLRQMEGFGVPTVTALNEVPSSGVYTRAMTSNLLTARLETQPVLASRSLGASIAINTRPGVNSLLLEEKIYVGMEGAPESFCLKDKILGPGGTYLIHIAQETGAKVMLRGKGSGHLETSAGLETPEPMHIYLQHERITGLQQAKDLANNLLQTIREEYQSQMIALTGASLLSTVQTVQTVPLISGSAMIAGSQANTLGGQTFHAPIIQPANTGVLLTNPSLPAQMAPQVAGITQLGLQQEALLSSALVTPPDQQQNLSLPPPQIVTPQLVVPSPASVAPPVVGALNQPPPALGAPPVGAMSQPPPASTTPLTPQLNRPAVTPELELLQLQMVALNHKHLEKQQAEQQLLQQRQQQQQLAAGGAAAVCPSSVTGVPVVAAATQANASQAPPALGTVQAQPAPGGLVPPASVASVSMAASLAPSAPVQSQSVPVHSAVPVPVQPAQYGEAPYPVQQAVPVQQGLPVQQAAPVHVQSGTAPPLATNQSTLPVQVQQIAPVQGGPSLVRPSPPVSVAGHSAPQPPISMTSQGPPVPVSSASQGAHPDPSRPPAGYDYYTKIEQEKRRFSEEKDKEPVAPPNLLGYQHGPSPLAAPSGSSAPPTSVNSSVTPAPPAVVSGTRTTAAPPPPPPPPPQTTPLKRPAPGAGDPLESKKAKPASSDISAASIDDGQEPVNTAASKYHKTLAKYSFNQYSSKPQMYSRENGQSVEQGYPPQGAPYLHGPPPPAPPETLHGMNYPPASQYAAPVASSQAPYTAPVSSQPGYQPGTESAYTTTDPRAPASQAYQTSVATSYAATSQGYDQHHYQYATPTSQYAASSYAPTAQATPTYSQYNNGSQAYYSQSGQRFSAPVSQQNNQQYTATSQAPYYSPQPSNPAHPYPPNYPTPPYGAQPYYPSQTDQSGQYTGSWPGSATY